jgi:hypothetical protein
MFSKKPIIEFRAVDEYSWEVCERPFPAKQNVPDWWKKMTPYIKSQENPDGNKMLMRNRVSSAHAKKCVPMLDALLSGYLIPLWADVQVEYKNGSPIINWRTHMDVFLPHGNNAVEVQNPIGYNRVVYKYLNKWQIITPPGYSVLVTPPFGFRQTGFQAIPAIIDTDKSNLEILFPMWVQDGFEGVVEKGTPMVQITPFKRSDWESKFTYLKNGEYSALEDKNFNGTLINHYLKKIWSKKDYS